MKLIDAMSKTCPQDNQPCKTNKCMGWIVFNEDGKNDTGDCLYRDISWNIKKLTKIVELYTTGHN